MTFLFDSIRKMHKHKKQKTSEFWILNYPISDKETAQVNKQDLLLNLLQLAKIQDSSFSPFSLIFSNQTAVILEERARTDSLNKITHRIMEKRSAKPAASVENRKLFFLFSSIFSSTKQGKFHGKKETLTLWMKTQIG